MRQSIILHQVFIIVYLGPCANGRASLVAKKYTLPAGLKPSLIGSPPMRLLGPLITQFLLVISLNPRHLIAPNMLAGVKASAKKSLTNACPQFPAGSSPHPGCEVPFES